MKDFLRTSALVGFIAFAMSGLAYAGVIDFPGTTSNNSNNVAANDPANGNVWTGVAESFTAQDPQVSFGFYVANYSGGPVTNSPILFSLYVGDGQFTTLLKQVTATISLANFTSGLVQIDLSSISLVPGNRYTVVASLPSQQLPPLGTYSALSVLYNSLSDSYTGGRFYFVGGTYDESLSAYSLRDLAFKVTPTGSSACQTNVTRLSQGDPLWASNLYDHSTSLLIKNKGCALTSLSMALNTAGSSNNPGTLNQFMAITDTDYDGLGVNWGPATRDASGGRLEFHARRINSINNYADAMQYLDTTVCQQGEPVIVGVNLAPDGTPGHYVLVSGKIGNDFQIADPGYSNTRLSQYNNDFETRGFVADPPGDISELDFAIGDAAELLIVDPSQRRVGYDPTQGEVLEDIPQSAYFRDSLIDDVTGAPPTETTHLVEIFQPSPGTYQIIVSGKKLGTYVLSTRMFSQDGSSQPDSTISGVSGPGASSSFSIQIASSSGVGPILLRRSTFQSTLADISNNLKLGLIDNQRVANSLSEEIKAAQFASSLPQKFKAAQKFAENAKDEVLKVFTNEVRTQAGKHIKGIAVQVLLEDAKSLSEQ